MNIFVTILFVAVATVSAQHQQLDPSYLRQYYAQAAQHANGQPARASTPIFEPSEQSQQYSAPKQNYPRPAQPQPHYVQEQRARQFAPQEIQYQQAQQQQQPRPQLKQKRPFQQEEDDEIDQNSSYQFGFDVKDDEFTNYQNRKESRDNGVIKGSYSVVDSDGFLRTVNYVADPKEGFKAEVVREPTDIVVKVPVQKPQEEPQHGFRQAVKQAPQYSQQPPQQYRQAPQQARQHQQPDYSQYQQ